MEYTILTDTTNSENQDRAAIFRKNGKACFVLSDGAGGIGGGLEAAQIVIDSLRESNDDDFIDILEQVDSAVVANANAGEATGVYITLQGNLLSGASVGDSEAWLVTNDDVIFLTENQISKPPLGSGLSIPVQFRDILFSGVLLITSDGLTKYSYTENIVSVIRKSNNLETCAKDLI